MENIYCVIMAGGKGERFWPLSRENTPKPFLRLLGTKTMIQHTVERALRITSRDRIVIVLGKAHLEVAREQLGFLVEENFLVEPEGRDTAACIGFAGTWVSMKDDKAVMVTLPADHYIPDVDAFAKTIDAGAHFASSGDDFVTVGVRPSRPETGYGYIHAPGLFGTTDGVDCFRVERFVEKPDPARAAMYLEAGDYFWNGGIFIWRVSTLLQGIREHIPDLSDGLLKIRDALSRGDGEVIRTVYQGLRRLSIDYGLMEKAGNVLMVPADFAWDDVGTWESLSRIAQPDDSGNHSTGDVVSKDARNCIVFSDGVTIGVLGVSNLVIVATDEGVLVAGADRAQEVREIARMIADRRSTN